MAEKSGGRFKWLWPAAVIAAVVAGFFYFRSGQNEAVTYQTTVVTGFSVPLAVTAWIRSPRVTTVV